MTIAGRMDAFKLSEISLVDRGAQQPAIAVIEKAKWGDEQRRDAAKSGVARPDGSFPIADADDLTNALSDYNRVHAGDQPAVRTHIADRARALGLTDKLPAEWRAESGDAAVGKSIWDEGGNEVDAEIRAFAKRGEDLQKGSGGYGAPPIGLGPAKPGWPGGAAYTPGANAKPEGRAQLGRPPATGVPGDTDDPDEADPYAMPNWAAGDDWTARKTKASDELQKRARIVAKREGCSTQQGYVKVLHSPAGQQLYEAAVR